MCVCFACAELAVVRLLLLHTGVYRKRKLRLLQTELVECESVPEQLRLLDAIVGHLPLDHHAARIAQVLPGLTDDAVEWNLRVRSCLVSLECAEWLAELRQLDIEKCDLLIHESIG